MTVPFEAAHAGNRPQNFTVAVVKGLLSRNWWRKPLSGNELEIK